MQQKSRDMFTLAQRSSTVLLRQVQIQRQCLPTLYLAASRLLSTRPSTCITEGDTKKKRQHIVVALGGNALLKRGEALNIINQRNNIAEGISSLSDILKNNTITFVHGNGPQVGLLALQGAAYKKEMGTDTMDLDVLDAETEGMIGYMLEQEIDAALGEEGRKRGVATLLSQIIVDPNDEAFSNPTKFIGPVYSKEEAMQLDKPVRPDGDYYRQVVPSPRPLRLIDQQLTAVKLLMKNDCIVICAGGGGIPVITDSTENRLKGIEAVIDKDRAAAMLGKTLGADGLMILTDVRGVAVDYGKASEKYIRSVSPDVLLDLGNHFPAGSMGPKVESAVDFVQNEKDDAGGGKWSMIGSLTEAESVMNGESGTLVTNTYGPSHLDYYPAKSTESEQMHSYYSQAVV